MREKTKFNQWKNTDSVITWFKNLQNTKKLTFIQFDICEFYPSISKKLLNDAIEYANKFVKISREDKDLFFQAKKAFLFDDKQPWRKKVNENFDVTMGSYDGAETCDLVGLYLLSQLQKLNLDIGLYRDDGLACSSLTPRQTDLASKKICEIFKENGLKITIKANMKSVNYLDINLDLNSGLFKPYMKPNDTPIYVHKDSNHPPSILKNIPAAVNKRLSTISANQEVFENAAPPYQEALNKSGFEHKLKFEPEQPSSGSRRRNRGRNVTWFNPPFSTSVKTNIGSKFLKIIDTCFPPSHPLHKILNRNTLKISYKCMPNISRAISKHNSEVTKPVSDQSETGCNCRGGTDSCPVGGTCLTTSVIYRATVATAGSTETYTGLTGGTFKKRFDKHNSDFRHIQYRHSSTLSTYIWELKEQRISYKITWRIMDRAPVFNPITKKCRLCCKEKFYIMFKPDGATLNDRDEFYSTCRHRLQQLLGKIKN